MPIQLTDLSFRIKNLLTEQECNTLIYEYERRKIQANLEHSIDPAGARKISSSRAIGIPKTSPICEIIRSKTEESLNQWLEHLKSMDSFHPFGLATNLRYAHKFRLLKYNTGASIHQHVDQVLGNYATVTLNLNSDYEGGELVFFNGKHVVSLERGEAFIFPNDYYWLHETRPILKGVRYCANMFIGLFPLDEQLNIQRSTVPPDFNIKV
jgi:predicted 2-oxoglutarate/Fe(II)-dependent dioxygenase YbiX